MKQHISLIALASLALLMGLSILINPTPAVWGQRAQTLVTIFLGIFIEAVPFLLIGAVVSGLISEFVEPGLLQQFSPRQPLVAAMAGAALGLTFPVCECGVVPVTRRLQQKGLSLASSVAFLLAAPVLNPVVIASTMAAYGWSTMFWARMGTALLIAVVVGVFFHTAEPEAVLQYEHDHQQEHLSCTVEPEIAVANPPARRPRFWCALTVAGDEFLDMAQYLILGSLLAAGMQVLIPQSTLMAWGEGPVRSVAALMLLAFVLSVCSTVDAFVSLAFVDTFAPGAVLGFLVFGPMVDIKSLLLLRRVFRPRAVAYLVLLPLLMTTIVAIAYNMLGG